MALQAESPCITFHRDKVVLKPHLKFILKVVSEFPSEPILSSYLSSSWKHIWHQLKRIAHTGCVQDSAFFTDRTKAFRHPPPGMFLVRGVPKVKPFHHKILKWITQCISLYYQSAVVPVPPNVQTHSIRTQVTSSACFRSVPVSEIYKAAARTFVKHCASNLATRSVAKFRRTVSILLRQLKLLISTILKGYCLPATYCWTHIDTYSKKKELVLTLQ